MFGPIKRWWRRREHVKVLREIINTPASRNVAKTLLTCLSAYTFQRVGYVDLCRRRLTYRVGGLGDYIDEVDFYIRILNGTSTIKKSVVKKPTMVLDSLDGYLTRSDGYGISLDEGGGLISERLRMLIIALEANGKEGGVIDYHDRILSEFWVETVYILRALLELAIYTEDR